MWDYIKTLIDSPAKVRAAILWLGTILTNLAAKTTNQVDDWAVKILVFAAQDDDLWESVTTILPLIFGVKKIEDVKLEDNPEVGAIADRLALATGLAKHEVMAAFGSTSN